MTRRLINRRDATAGLFALPAGLVAGLRPAVAAPAMIAFDMLYKSFGVRGLQFSDRLLELKDAEVTITGYVAPPLKVESKFFVLTREPLALCPFCQSDADWPVDIVVINTRTLIQLVPAGSATTVVGRLSVGSKIDPETGFVSQIRVEDAVTRLS